MLRQFSAHAAAMGIQALPGRVANILPMGNGFMINFNGEILESRTIVLPAALHGPSRCQARRNFWAVAFPIAHL